MKNKTEWRESHIKDKAQRYIFMVCFYYLGQYLHTPITLALGLATTGNHPQRILHLQILYKAPNSGQCPLELPAPRPTINRNPVQNPKKWSGGLACPFEDGHTGFRPAREWAPVWPNPLLHRRRVETVALRRLSPVFCPPHIMSPQIAPTVQ